VEEIRSIPFCGACAREQEAYFAIGELTREETQGLRSEPLSKTLGKTLGETLERIRRQRKDGLAAARRLDFPSVDKPSVSHSRKAKQSKTQVVAGRRHDKRPNRMEHMSEDARVLIRAAQEVHAERHRAQTFLPGTLLPFPKAAKRTGIRADRQRYYDAIKDLEYEGAIEWDESARYARGTSTS